MRRRPNATKALIPNLLGKRRRPHHQSSRLAESMASVDDTQRVLKHINPGSLSMAQELDDYTQMVSQNVTNFLTDLDLAKQRTWNGSVDDAKRFITQTIGEASDVVTRKVSIGKSLRWPALIAYVDGMVDSQIVDQDVIWRLEAVDGMPETPPDTTSITQAILASASVESGKKWHKAILDLLRGMTLLFVEESSDILLIDTLKYTQRAITESKAEPAIKGPQEAFSDVTLVQMSQVRRRIVSPDLRFDDLTVGKYSRTKVQLTYVRGLTNPGLVDALKLRLAQVDRDWVQMGSELTAYLTDKRFTLFPVVRITDRVDIVSRDLLQGKVALLIANDPFAITLPNRLLDFYQTTQDYVFNFWESTLVRMIRAVGLLVGLYVMPLYIALTSVDPDLMPTRLILTLAGSRIGVPFPPVVEAGIMWIIVEILREAANRMTQQLSTPIGTVGAVIIGSAIVKAGLVDPVVIIGITLTALGLFTMPTFEMNGPWRWVFWILVLFSYVLGVYGLFLATFGLIGYLSSLEVFGVPYLAPFAPFDGRGIKDSLVRYPLGTMGSRPVAFQPYDIHKTAAPPRNYGTIHLEEWQQESD